MPDLPILISFVIAAFVVVIVPGVTVSALVITDLITLSAEDWQEANGTLRFRRTCGCVPAKSTSMESSPIVTLALTGSGVSSTPSSSTAASP